MTAANCECGRPAVAAGRCGQCVHDWVARMECDNCGEPGVPATAHLFRNANAWDEWLRAVETANDWPAGILAVVAPLVSPLDDQNADFVCRDCVTYCDDCGEPYSEADYASECCGPSCENCGEAWETQGEANRCCGKIHDYSYSPPNFRFREIDANGNVVESDHARPGVLFLGVELETEHASDLLDDWYENAREDFRGPRFVYAKSDGSLGPEGVEFVTMPATLAAFRKEWPWDAFAQLNADGARSWFADCGLHIHVSRTAFVDPLHAARFVVFQYRNRDRCVALAGRNSDQWASWETDEILKTGNLPNFVKGKDENRARYRALNFQNYATIELRYFRGNLRRAGLLRAVEFVAAVHEYTRSVTTADALRGGLDWPAFALWIRNRRDDYPYAAHWVATDAKRKG